ncbi:hypothetical protein GH714_010762 [Hevea brasiliensis]|uniref:Uncharacterized protein n=1 Tax=Hevea brasiliensis TaxID=3981 RepID=A0A6A6NCH4_HEVBR|nr:hypothetical protein GH714_010762 [Hevea brasiliensis]
MSSQEMRTWVATLRTWLVMDLLMRSRYWVNMCKNIYGSHLPSTPTRSSPFPPYYRRTILSRVPLRKPLAGFEAVLLALYAHETTSRNGQAITVNIPDLSNSSVYHETKEASRNNSTDLNLAVISPSLEPHGTVRSTRRARIVGVALELYFSKISLMPVGSKIDFCEFCEVWAGQEGDMYKENLGGGENGDSRGCGDEEGDSSGGGGDEGESSGGGGKEGESSGGGGKEGDSSGGGGKEGESRGGGKEGDSSGGGGGGGGSVYEEKGKKEGRIPLPWELLQPALRILGHCLLGPKKIRN